MKHVSPPGGWEPPEPSWVQTVRNLDASITTNVKRYIRYVKFQMVVVPLTTSVLTGSTVWLILHWLAPR